MDRMTGRSPAPDHHRPGDASGREPGPVDPRPPAEYEESAQRIFGDRLPLAIRYAELLMTDGVVRGLIGPREAPRIWERHLLNCAVVAELIEQDARVADVGSGAGLPGIVLAVARPDLSVILVEPLARRTAFLLEAATALGLDRTTVVRARAEECVPGRGESRFELADVVTARAVAPLDRLTAWCLPLAAKGGRMLALKGQSAVEEVEAHRDVIARLGGDSPVIRQCGAGLVEPPTTVIEITRTRLVEGRTPSGHDRKGRRAPRSHVRP
jgi:16S rRNA (guanine527-N7)-methyltransferase